jgi:signal transduction histidine kinase
MSLELKTRITEVQWRWVLSAAVGVAALAYLLVWVIIVVYVFALSIVLGGKVDSVQLSSFASLMGTWGLPTLHSLLVIPAASWVVRKVSVGLAVHGALVGLASAIINQLIGLFYGPLLLDELTRIAPLSIMAGLLGGIWGLVALRGHQALYQASQAVSVALSPQAIVAALGEYLASSKEISQVSLWQLIPQVQPGAPREFELLATWTPDVAQTSSPCLRLKATQLPIVPSLEQRSSLSFNVKELPVSERAMWERQDIRSSILLPLFTTSNGQVGLLMVASRRPNGFPRGTLRTYLTISAQVALALENLRLVDQARQAGVLRERQRLSHEIHDTLAQGFTSIVMNLEAAEGTLPHNLKPTQHYLDQARRTARESLAEARRLVWALRPESLERSSLPEALARLAERYSGEGETAVRFSAPDTPCSLHPETEVTLLRAAQESLTNVRKYAQASQVVMTLSYIEDLVALDVRDDGIGFDTTQMNTGDLSGGFGIQGMRERVEQLGGTLVVESTPGKGVALMIELPANTES